MWKSECNEYLEKAKKNGLVPIGEQNEFSQSAIEGIRKGKMYLGRAEHKKSTQLLIRLLATLDMIVKDPDQDVVIRFGNRKDFKAALKLYEKITLPRYLRISYEDNLFDNYEHVEPYPSWEYRFHCPQRE